MDESLPEIYMDPDDLEEWYLTHTVGTLESGWQFLRMASASAYLNSVERISQVSSAWATARSRADPGEAAFVLEANYSFLASGPLLSATLLPAFALESVLGLFANAAFVSDRLSGDSLVYAVLST